MDIKVGDKVVMNWRSMYSGIKGVIVECKNYSYVIELEVPTGETRVPAKPNYGWYTDASYFNVVEDKRRDMYNSLMSL